MKKISVVLAILLAITMAFVSCDNASDPPADDNGNENPAVTFPYSIDLSTLSGYSANDSGLVWTGTPSNYAAVFTLPFSEMGVPEGSIKCSIVGETYDASGASNDIANDWDERLVIAINDASGASLGEVYNAGVDVEDEHKYSTTWGDTDNAATLVIKIKGTGNAYKVVVSDITFYNE